MAINLRDRFVQMARKESGTHLLNVYKGVPLSFSVKIVEVGDTYLRVLADNYQMVCMYLEKSTLIQSDELPEIIQAEVIELDTRQHLALLANFQFVEKGIGNRAEVRIQPKDPLLSEIQDKSENVTIKGELADISREGLGIYLDQELFSAKLIYPEAQLDIIVDLPGDYLKSLEKIKNQPENGFYDRFSRENIRYNPVSSTGQRHSDGDPGHATWLTAPNIHVKARVVNFHLEITHERYRIGMRMLPNSQASSIISQFMSQRQGEIIKEIRELYQLLVSPENINHL